MRVTIEEAATLLGIEKGSVKKRIQRGKLRSERDARGTTWVYVDTSETVRDESQGQSTTDRGELVGTLKDQVADLRARLDREQEANRENRRIIAALTSRIPEIEAPAAPAQESAPPESREEAAQEPADNAERARPRPAGAEAPAASESVSWWRRMFGS